MKKSICLLLALLAATSLLCGCGGTKSVQLELVAPSYPASAAPAGTADLSLLWGTWLVDGFVSNGKLYSVHIDKALEDLYDTTSLVFHEDDTYLYYNGFFTEGTYSPLAQDGQTAFLLTEERTYRLSFQDGELVEIESPDSGNDLMIAVLLSGGSLCYGKYDSLTGGLMASEDPLYFSMDGTPIIPFESGSGTQSQAPSPQTPGKTEGSGSSSGNSYERILKEYTKKMENAAPGLVREFKAKAAGISDMTKLAQLCTDKVGELAEICTDGVSEMASLMYDRGDSYSTYESWAMKLQDKYTEIAQDIQDAYLDAAMKCF